MAHNKASLLGLPLELRWEILFLVLLDNSRPAPPGPSEARFQDRRSIERPVHHRNETYAKQRLDEQRRVRFEAKPYPNPVLSLLLSNKQLCYETLEVLRSKRFVSSPVRCRLDVVYINNASIPLRLHYFYTSHRKLTRLPTQGTLFPTWLSVPCREITHIDELHVQFRLFNRPDYMPKNRSSTIFIMIGLDLGLCATFKHFIDCIMNEGPRGAGRITVGRLVMDFLPADEGSAVLPLGQISLHGQTEDYFSLYPHRSDNVGNFQLSEPGLRPAAMMMGFALNTMSSWYRQEARRLNRGNNQQLAKIREVEYRLAGKAQRLDEAVWFPV